MSQIMFLEEIIKRNGLYCFQYDPFFYRNSIKDIFESYKKYYNYDLYLKEDLDLNNFNYSYDKVTILLIGCLFKNDDRFPRRTPFKIIYESIFYGIMEKTRKIKIIKSRYFVSEGINISNELLLWNRKNKLKKLNI